MQKQDLSGIDWKKCKLPTWCDVNLSVKMDHGRPTIVGDHRLDDSRLAFRALDGWAASPGTHGHLLAEIDDLRAICAQVDTFIATELARLAEPDWVEVKWTEVSRITGSGRNVRWRYQANGSGWIYSVGCKGRSELEYRVDRKTLPEGVALYEPEWVEIPWSEATELAMDGATVIDDHREALTAANNYSATSLRTYKADRKTCPPGWEARKRVEPPKTKAPAGREWHGCEGDETWQGRIALNSINGTGRQFLVPLDAGERDAMAACVAAFDEATKPEPPWLPCTREEAEAHPEESEVTWGTKRTWTSLDCAHGIEPYRSSDKLNERPEYRTRAKLDRWVKVPWGDVGGLDRAGSKLQYHETKSLWSDRYCDGPGDSETSYRADRTTLPPGYVLGVGFVEQPPHAPIETP